MSIRYPWPTFTAPLACRVDDVHVDGKAVAPRLIDTEHQRLRLDGVTWGRFDCRVTVTTDEPTPAGVDDIRNYVLVSSTGANTRLSFPLDEIHDRSPSGRVVVTRSVAAGTFTIQAHAGALVAGRRRLIGDCDPWTIVLERHEAPIPPGGPPFDIDWVAFTSPDAPLAARENASAHAFMDLTPSPRLLLNAGVDGFQKLLHNNAARLERRRVRDVLSTSVARYAIATLFRAAVSEIVAYDDGPPQPPTTALYRQICEAVADRMAGIGDVAELYDRLVAIADDRMSDTDLWARIDIAIEDLTGYTDALTTASREVADG